MPILPLGRAQRIFNFTYMHTISIGELISFGWRTFKARPWFFVGVGVIGFVVQLVLNAISSVDFGFILGILLSILFSMGLTALYLKAHDDPKSARYKDLWHPHGFLKFLGTVVLIGIAVTIGFILLIVPGIILSLMFMFATYLVIDRGLGPINAIKESIRITKGNRLKLFLLAIVLTLLNLLGVLLLVVGLIVTVPVSLLAVVHAYRLLSGTATTSSTPAPTPAPEGAPVTPAAM